MSRQVRLDRAVIDHLVNCFLVSSDDYHELPDEPIREVS
jgi:hypothetical protein